MIQSLPPRSCLADALNKTTQGVFNDRRSQGFGQPQHDDSPYLGGGKRTTLAKSLSSEMRTRFSARHTSISVLSGVEQRSCSGTVTTS